MAVRQRVLRVRSTPDGVACVVGRRLIIGDPAQVLAEVRPGRVLLEEPGLLLLAELGPFLAQVQRDAEVVQVGAHRWDLRLASDRVLWAAFVVSCEIRVRAARDGSADAGAGRVSHSHLTSSPRR